MIQKRNQGDIDYRLSRLEFFTEIPDDDVEEIIPTEQQVIKETANQQPKLPIQNLPISNTTYINTDNNAETSTQSRDSNILSARIDQIQEMMLTLGLQLQSVTSAVAQMTPTTHTLK